MSKQHLTDMLEAIIAGKDDDAKAAFHTYITDKVRGLVAEKKGENPFAKGSKESKEDKGSKEDKKPAFLKGSKESKEDKGSKESKESKEDKKSKESKESKED